MTDSVSANSTKVVGADDEDEVALRSSASERQRADQSNEFCGRILAL